MPADLKEQYDKISRYCFFKIHNEYIAEDLTQETFLRYFSQNTYLEHGKQMAYLYTIARNLCINYYKKEKWEELLEDVSVDNMGNLEMNIVVRQAVNRLPEELQELILLRFVNELSIKEIAFIMNLSRFSVRRRMNNALEKLNELLGEEDFT